MLLDLACQTLVNMRPGGTFTCYQHGSPKRRIGSRIHIPVDGTSVRGDQFAIVDQDQEARHENPSST